MELPVNKIICGNAVDILATIPSETISCVVTSPPYFHLRKYGCEFDWPDGWRGELGLEPTIDMFLDHLMMIFNEVWRVMRPDGTLWVNIGDCYSSGGRKTYDHRIISESSGLANRAAGLQRPSPETPAKSMCGIPERFMLRMLDAGWILRQKIIWAKGISFCDTYAGSCMPDSAKDRFNKNGFEPLYFFTKTGKYWFEQQYEDAEQDCHSKELRATSEGGKRILRNVWAINSEPSAEKHYAAYPTKLVEPCIKAGCPKEICVKCGRPRYPIVKTNYYAECVSAEENKSQRERGLKIGENKDVQFSSMVAHKRAIYQKNGYTATMTKTLTQCTTCNQNLEENNKIVTEVAKEFPNVLIEFNKTSQTCLLCQLLNNVHNSIHRK